MSFFAELKQRKVVRVAAAYLVVAWLAIQLASIALPTFGAPIWVLRVVILLLAIGFPIALILAWAVELSPQGVKFDATGVGSKRMLAVSVVLLVLAFAWYYRGQPALRSAAPAVAVAVAPERSIAVLPFVNMSGDPKNEYFSDGLAETTLDMLAQVPNLKVIARTSSFAFKGKAQDMRRIGAALGAAHLLEGSVQQAGDTLRITVQLIKAADGTHLWSQHYDRPMVDLFKIQDEIATAVVQALQVALTPQQQEKLVSKRTDNVAAYNEYLKGMALLPNRNVTEMREAAQHFENAIALDPGFARAYVGAANAYNLLGYYGTNTADERERMKRYLDRALQLAPNLGEAHIARAGQIFNTTTSITDPAVDAEFRRGLTLAPNNALGYQWYGELVDSLGRHEEALALFRKSLALDPLAPVPADNVAATLVLTGHLDQALALMDEAIAEHSDAGRHYQARSLFRLMNGDAIGALRDLDSFERLNPEAYNFRAFRCSDLIALGALAEARTCLAAMAAKAPDAPNVLRGQARLAWLAGNTRVEQGFIARIQPADESAQATFLMRAGQPAQALALYRRADPGFFLQPVPTVYSTRALDAVRAGAALRQTGADAQGRALIKAAIAAVAHAPYYGDRGWNVVYGYAELGEKDQAFAEMKAAVDSGWYLDLLFLDHEPLIQDLRKDPRYEMILAPARAKAAAQVEAARKAGLL